MTFLSNLPRRGMTCLAAAFSLWILSGSAAWASETDMAIPDLHKGSFHIAGQTISAWNLLFGGAVVICITLGISLYLRYQIKNLPAHESMLKISEIIFQTCKTYLIQQGKFLIMLFVLIGSAMAYYFMAAASTNRSKPCAAGAAVLGGRHGRILLGRLVWHPRQHLCQLAAPRLPRFAGEPWDVVNIPLRAGMSVGLFLISLELVMMVIILLFVDREIVGYCFLGFAIGESLGASALRIAGGIFTKIADIGSDLMKIVFNVKEDDPRNPGVIADCTGDNAGDSVGPTADGFETYGVTGVALISFITLAIPVEQADLQAKLIVWIFAMRFLMDFMSGVSYFINQAISRSKYVGKKEFNFEEPLTRLIWIAAVLCISTSFFMSWLLLSDLAVGGVAMPKLWWQLASIISCGTLAAVLIPEFTKVFTSSHSKHVHEIVTASREGGTSLTILSGLVAGYFSAFWMGLLIAGLMGAAFFVSQQGLEHADARSLALGATVVGVGSIFAFGLVAFGFLCMGPVTIAVDSYGPVTDNAQSVFELSQIEKVPGIREKIKAQFGFDPDFEGGKHYLEANDSAGNTFKATAKPVLIGTAVVGATTMIFSIILLLGKAGLLHISLTDAPVLLGFICGGTVIFWFSGASMQAVTTGAYRAVEFIKKNLDLNKTEADIEDSNTVVTHLHAVCPDRHVEHLHRADDHHAGLCLFRSQLLRGLPDLDRRLRPVPGDLDGQLGRMRGTTPRSTSKSTCAKRARRCTPPSVVGDTVGDPFKDTTSVALNPIIKFSTLFGLLAVEIAVEMKEAAHPGRDDATTRR